MIVERLEGALRAAEAAGARAAEASHDGRELETVRFAGSTVTGATLVKEQHTRIRVLVGDRLGAATTTSLDPAVLADAAARAVAVARLMPATPDQPEFAHDGPLPSVPQPEPSAPGSWPPLLETIFGVAARHGLTCAGSLTNGPRTLAVATSAGARREARLPEASLSVFALDGRASGHAAFTGRRLDEVDVAALASTAAETGAAARDPVELPAGEYDVLFSPHAVAELLEWMSNTSFSARAVVDGTSLLAGRHGELVCDPRITVADDWDHPASVRRAPFDSEGSPKRRVVPITAGRGGDAVTDLATAARLGARSTGHAGPIGTEYVEGPCAAHVVLSPGTDSTDALLGKMERGLYVTRLHYVNGFLDTRRAVMTGMTRDGTFLVEHGRRGRPVRNLRFTDSILDALSPERLGGIGDRLVAVATTWTNLGAILCPALLLRRFRFTGQSK